MNRVRQCLVLISHLGKMSSRCTPFLWIKGPENKHSNVMPTVFHIWTWGCQSCVAACHNLDDSAFVFYLRHTIVSCSYVVKGILFSINWDCFTNLRIFVLHLCRPLTTWMDVVLLGNLNHWSASLKNVQRCGSASVWYDI